MNADLGLMQSSNLEISSGSQLAPGNTSTFGGNFGAPGEPVPTSPIAPGPSTGLPPSLSGTSTQMNGVGLGQQPRVIDYTTEFPALAQQGNGPASMSSMQQDVSAPTWGSKTTTSHKVRSSQATQVFHVPAEERRHLMTDSQFGERSSEQTECNDIMQQTGTHIELCESKDRSLTIVVSGKRQNVEEARIQIVKRLQTQAQRELSIPKDHHRVIIGKEGKNLQELERATACRIAVPQRDNNSDVIRISGPREGIERAVHQIQLISDEQSKLAQERLTIPKIYYPWIKGPNNEVVDRIHSETSARINIPPPMAISDVIVITGEKEGVYEAARQIRKIYDEKVATCQTVSIQVAQSQHKYVSGSRGSGIAEILKETGVSVELPPEDSHSSTITLRGEQQKLGSALALVYAKASSVIQDTVQCPAWLHRFIIGPKGQNIKKLVGDPPSVLVEFSEENDGVISIVGSPNEVKQARTALAELSTQLQKELTFEVLRISPQIHRHIIGRAGSNINHIKEETGVLVSIPDESSNSDEVRLEGKKEMVGRAREMIMEIVGRIENEKSRDIIIDQRFHGQIIGSKGGAIRELRDKYPGVNVSFPEQGRKSDIVTLRGPKDEVDRCYRHMQTMVKELVENNHQVRVPIFKDFHKFIIGKGGQNIRKIREETDTRIDLPAEGADTDVITITGTKTNVEKAKDMLLKIQNELANIVTVEVSVPKKVHSQLLQKSGRLIASIQEECGGVNIKFPPENSALDKVNIRGPKDDVEKAQKLLAQLAKDKELASFTAEVKAKPELFRFLIGRSGSTIKKLRDQHANVRFLFPRPQDEDQETIHLVGKKEDVETAQKALETIVSDLNKVVEAQMDVDPKWHRHFVGRRAQEVHNLQDQFGGVIISFPRQGTDSSKVTLKGAQECVDGVRKRIAEIVADLEAQVTVRVYIPHQHHRALLGNRGADIQDICQDCNVQIKFPDREPQESHDGQHQQVNGHNGEQGSPVHSQNGEADARDYIIISGRDDNCQHAKERLEALVPITESVNVPYDYHRFLIGPKGEDVRKMMREYKVNIAIPQRDEHRDDIIITGTKVNVQEAIEAIKKRVEVFDEEAKERERRNNKVIVEVPVEHHSKLIGPKGTTINRLRQEFSVNIAIPKPEDENPEGIIITGYLDKANAAKETIERMIKRIESLVTQSITLDPRVHSRLLGSKGRNIRKLMDDFNVEIRFPRQTDPDQNIVVVSGETEDSVFDCIDELRNLEEEYLQDVVERHQYRHPTFVDDKPRKESQEQIAIKGAPWEFKNTEDDFPTMGPNGIESSSSATAAAPRGAWGVRR